MFLESPQTSVSKTLESGLFAYVRNNPINGVDSTGLSETNQTSDATDSADDFNHDAIINEELGQSSPDQLLKMAAAASPVTPRKPVEEKNAIAHSPSPEEQVQMDDQLALLDKLSGNREANVVDRLTTAAAVGAAPSAVMVASNAVVGGVGVAINAGYSGCKQHGTSNVSG